MSGLRYETGRDMPPGMQELTAEKLVKQLREAAIMVAAAPIPETVITPPVAAMTNGERIRSMSDEELVEKLFLVYRMACDHVAVDISNNWCDLQGGCCGEGGEELECDVEKHKACILRWLQSPTKEE